MRNAVAIDLRTSWTTLGLATPLCESVVREFVREFVAEFVREFVGEFMRDF